MEYDNDKIIKPAYTIEIVYWILLAVCNPLFNAVTFFSTEPKMWLLLSCVHLLIFPAYIIYARLLVPQFLFEGRYLAFSLLSAGFLVFIQLLIASAYSLIPDSSKLGELAYFSYTPSTFVRECLWALLYMFLATNIALMKKALDEKDIITDLKKDNTYFKLKYLRSQINPHFLFNTLNSIYSLSLQKSDKTPEVVVKLADIMRYFIDDCNETKILLSKEIDFIQNYLEIEKIRHKADIRFTVEGETKGILIEPFLFISFIENGFKHALNNSYADAFVYITLRVGPSHITLTVVNNTDIDIATQAKKIYGTGIKNSKSLLELLYPGYYALDIIQTEKLMRRKSLTRFKNARDRLKLLYPDAHTLDVILSNNAFTVSLIIKFGLM